MLSNYRRLRFEGIKNGMELEVVFDDVSPEISLPKWKPVRK